MTKFVENVNKYLDELKIKQSYLSMVSGIDKNKMSRILTGVQSETGADMEKIAKGLGKNVKFFLADPFCLPVYENRIDGKVTFYAGCPSKKQEEIARNLVEYLKNVDEILSAEIRFKNVGRL